MSPHTTPHRRSKARRRLTIGLGAGVAAVIAASAPAVNAQASPEGPDDAKAATPSGMNGPYLYLGWGNPPDPVSFLKETGTKQLTMAFILSDGGCSPAWDGQRPLGGGQDEQAIKAIQQAGGDVTPSIGGWSGNKLGEACSSAQDLAGAYQKVIDAYGLKSIDIDIESSEVENAEVRQRVIDALKIVKDKNAGIKVYVTFGTTTKGPNENGKDLINKGAAAKLDVDAWTVMPFDFGDGTTDIAGATKSAVDGLKDQVKAAYGLSDEEAYKKSGLSSMNGKTDVEGESVSPGDFQQIVDYAKSKNLSRVSFWSVNRDRPCAGGGASDSCSGIDQQQWEFSKILAGYGG
ncbi:chitinase [Streptomyces sp. NBC_01795]|uniref:chitinase n=1 Tax=unclassified Streptomyces TaxID=2593676 RepID=UPI002DDB62DF|nr:MULTISPECIES: chitinase [unclassified Streptomyces]WSA92266.1 chitinase [Streptomyces sp. NBC_01795]WSB76632.1 chitinase [Streptomyces sp. NBC_01775]WSS15081.1 chitinase [Streptomyces sp. NBC_01186]